MKKITMTETFKFLITTDNHLGYKHDDFIRRKDSFMAFAEALKVARDRDVDFILLGGDLFHMNKPSSEIEHKCMKIIRQHMNARAYHGTTFQRLSGNFSHSEKLNHPNFEDPNLNVAFPIMTIHGNHDDPTGPSARSVCEKLATAGLLNYFGIFKSVEKVINVQPIVLEKNGIKIALYGIGFIPDQKLRVAFEKNEVTFAKPPPDAFNVLVVHQNRVPYVKNKYIPDEYFPKYFHLIIRGHEHDLQEPAKIPDSIVDGLVYQPGSTVATSISTVESGPKKVGLITVRLGAKMDYELIPLLCYRKVIFKDISQKEIFNHIKKSDGRKKITPIEYRNLFVEYVKLKAEAFLQNYELSKKESQLSGNDKESAQDPVQTNLPSLYKKLHRFALPLMRLRLEYAHKVEKFDDMEVVSSIFPKRAANRDIILFRKQKIIHNENGQAENVTFSSLNDDEDDQDEFDVINLGDEKRDTIDVMIENYFIEKPEKDRLEALSLHEYTKAVQGAAEDGNVISKVLCKKKQNILMRFKAALISDEVAERDFSDRDKVRDWMLAAFKHDDRQSESFGGDIDVCDDDDDVIFCDS